MILENSEILAIRTEYVETLSENLSILRRGHFDSFLKELIPQVIEEMLFGDGTINFDLTRSPFFNEATKELWDTLKENVPNTASKLVLQAVEKGIREKKSQQKLNDYICMAAGLPNIWSALDTPRNIFNQPPVEPKTIGNLNHE